MLTICDYCGKEYETKETENIILCCGNCLTKHYKMKTRKSTNKELVTELEALNTHGQYNQLIANAKSNRYHDYKNPDDIICGKMELAKDLHQYSELSDLRAAVIDGEYDEEADEADKEMMRKDTPENMWPLLGL